MTLNRISEHSDIVGVAQPSAFRLCALSAIAGVCLLLCQAAAPAADVREPAAGSSIVRIDPRGSLRNFQPLTVFAAKGHPVPAAATRGVYDGESGLRVGIWEGQPGLLQLTNYPFDEYCLIVSGELVITNAAGQDQTFRAGDSFVIPKGFSGTWDMRTTVRKQSVVATSFGNSSGHRP